MFKKFPSPAELCDQVAEVVVHIHLIEIDDIRMIDLPQNLEFLFQLRQLGIQVISGDALQGKSFPLVRLLRN